MLKRTLLLAFIVFTVLGVKAQTGNNAIMINAETELSPFGNDYGGGLQFKGLFGIGRAAQLTLTAGPALFSSRNDIEIQTTRTWLLPVLVGYRHNMNRFFIEPQIGFGRLGVTISNNGNEIKQSTTAIIGAIGLGYTYKRFDFGARFQTEHGINGRMPGWYNPNHHYTSLFIGFRLFSKRH